KLIIEGIPPYTEVGNMKLPGTYYAYAFMMQLFGANPAGIHLGLLLVNAFSIILLFSITRSWLSTHAALYSCATFAVLSLSSSVLGFAAHATHFVVLFSLIGLYFFTIARHKGKLFYYFISCFFTIVSIFFAKLI
ncbi:MAG: glycosyltransferase family 39 protein, partial [Flavobacteriaceae bacterium]|nr:glycosyltransferase family 39 protein [Flavobacteriaceae bacterium]